jgi:hypothetical protein
MFSADQLYYEIGEDGFPIPEMKIKQLDESNYKQVDIYPSQNKLIELRDTKFRANKTQDVAFILSAISTLKKVNLYVIDGVVTKCCCITRKKIEWSYQHLRTFDFDHAPCALLELHHNKFSCATGNDIEIIDIHS